MSRLLYVHINNLVHVYMVKMVGWTKFNLFTVYLYVKDGL